MAGLRYEGSPPPERNASRSGVLPENPPPRHEPHAGDGAFCGALKGAPEEA